MDAPEETVRHREALRARQTAAAGRPLRRLGEALVALLVFGGMIYVASRTGDFAFQVVAVGAGSFGYMLLRRLWALEDRLTSLEDRDLDGTP